jgi:hypothetical protein
MLFSLYHIMLSTCGLSYTCCPGIQAFLSFSDSRYFLKLKAFTVAKSRLSPERQRTNEFRDNIHPTGDGILGQITQPPELQKDNTDTHSM